MIWLYPDNILELAIHSHFAMLAQVYYQGITKSYIQKLIECVVFDRIYLFLNTFDQI